MGTVLEYLSKIKSTYLAMGIGTRLLLWLFILGIVVTTAWAARYHASSSPHFQFWLQVASGSWQPPRALGVAKFAYSIGAIIAVVLNVGTILAVVLVVWGYITLERKQAMTIASALRLRDRTVKEEIYNRLSAGKNEAEKLEMFERVEEAFTVGEERWEQKHLPLLLGKEQIKQFLEMWNRLKDQNIP